MPPLRRIVGAGLRRFQGLAFYRRTGRRIFSRIIIREANEVDKLAVQAWFNPHGPSTHSTRPNPLATEWVAYRGRRLAGFIQLIRHPPEHFPYIGHWLFSLAVKPLHQGFGLGEKLSLAVIERAIAEGAPTIELLVKKDNDRAIRLYRKLGFEMYTIPELEPQLELERESTGCRRVVMRKQLAKPK
jgi:ribosomal protein S18 acetylase RimI-like enzyme